MTIHPSRLSVDKTDPGYQEFVRFSCWPYKISVYLDGVEQLNVITVDAKEGWLLRAKAGPDGELMHTRGEFEYETVHGKVTIAIKNLDDASEAQDSSNT